MMRLVLAILAFLPYRQARTNQDENCLATRLLPELNRLKETFLSSTFHSRSKRSETISSQTVYQFQKKQKKCKNLRSYGIASGSNALSYMSFVASVITLVLNINNNINANNNNNNQANINFGNNNNLVSNLNQNVGNNFNLMFPPGRKRRHLKDDFEKEVEEHLKRIMVQAQCYL